MSVGEDDGASVDGTVGDELEGDADGLSEDGNAVGSSVPGNVGAKDGTCVGVLLGDSDCVVVGSAVTG